MELNVYERLLLLNIMPGEGDVITLRIIRDLQRELSFDEAEHKALEFGAPCQVCGKHVSDGHDGHSYAPVPGRMQWRASADLPKDVPMGEVALELVRKRLRALSDQGKLTLQHLPLYERFVEGNGERTVREAEKLVKGA